MEDFVTETEKDSTYLNHKQTHNSKQEEEEEGDHENSSSAASSGFIHLLTDLVSPTPKSPSSHPFHDGNNGSSTEHKESCDDVGDGDSTAAADDGGGMINTLISNIFHQNQPQQQEEEDDKVTAPATTIIDSITSHLPAAALPDEVDPQPDEASILIHSIIHD